MHRDTQIVIIKLFTLALVLIFPTFHHIKDLYEITKKTDSKNIQKALDSVNWERLFDQKDINAQVAAFNETILNIFRNYVPNKYITIDDKDPVWMNETIKSKIKAKNAFYKKYIQNGRFESDFVYLENLTIELNELISSTKALYYENLAKKLNNLLLQAKTY